MLERLEVEIGLTEVRELLQLERRDVEAAELDELEHLGDLGDGPHVAGGEVLGLGSLPHHALRDGCALGESLALASVLLAHLGLLVCRVYCGLDLAGGDGDLSGRARDCLTRLVLNLVDLRVPLAPGAAPA